MDPQKTGVDGPGRLSLRSQLIDISLGKSPTKEQSLPELFLLGDGDTTVRSKLEGRGERY